MCQASRLGAADRVDRSNGCLISLTRLFGPPEPAPSGSICESIVRRISCIGLYLLYIRNYDIPMSRGDLEITHSGIFLLSPDDVNTRSAIRWARRTYTSMTTCTLAPRFHFGPLTTILNPARAPLHSAAPGHPAAPESPRCATVALYGRIGDRAGRVSSRRGVTPSDDASSGRSTRSLCCHGHWARPHGRSMVTELTERLREAPEVRRGVRSGQRRSGRVGVGQMMTELSTL